MAEQKYIYINVYGTAFNARSYFIDRPVRTRLFLRCTLFDNNNSTAPLARAKVYPLGDRCPSSLLSAVSNHRPEIRLVEYRRPKRLHAVA